MHVTLTTDRTRILTALTGVKVGGRPKLLSGLLVAQLALKHRQDKHQRQRIVIFVGSPVEEERDKLVQLGKKLKKNNVSVDVVSFGEDAVNKDKLEAFIGAVNSGDTRCVGPPAARRADHPPCAATFSACRPGRISCRMCS